MFEDDGKDYAITPRSEQLGVALSAAASADFVNMCRFAGGAADVPAQRSYVDVVMRLNAQVQLPRACHRAFAERCTQAAVHDEKIRSFLDRIVSEVCPHLVTSKMPPALQRALRRIAR